jgi:hypothetical protein
MARLATAGFEYGSLPAEAALGGFTLNSTWTFGTTYAWATSGMRSGKSALQMLASGSGATLPYLQWVLGTSHTNTYYARLAINASNWGSFSSGSGGLGWRPLGLCDSGFVGAELQIDGSGNLGLYNNGGTSLLSSGTTPLSLNTWYVLELSWVPSTGVAVVRVNGVQVQTGTSTAASSTNITAYSCNLAGTSLSALVDDFAANDSTGTAGNSWCGLGQVVVLTPISDSANTGFKAGLTGTTNLFAAVDTLPPAGKVHNSSTTTSQITCVVSSTTDNYIANLQSYTTGGVPTGAAIVLVQPVASIGSSATTSLTGGLRSTANPVIAETTGVTGTTATSTWPTGWANLKAAVTYAPTVVLGTSPKIELRKGTASTAGLDSAFMGMLVEYTYTAPTDWVVVQSKGYATFSDNGLALAFDNPVQAGNCLFAHVCGFANGLPFGTPTDTLSSTWHSGGDPIATSDYSGITVQGWLTDLLTAGGSTTVNVKESGANDFNGELWIYELQPPPGTTAVAIDGVMGHVFGSTQNSPSDAAATGTGADDALIGYMVLTSGTSTSAGWTPNGSAPQSGDYSFSLMGVAGTTPTDFENVSGGDWGAFVWAITPSGSPAPTPSMGFFGFF